MIPDVSAKSFPLPRIAFLAEAGQISTVFSDANRVDLFTIGPDRGIYHKAFIA